MSYFATYLLPDSLYASWGANVETFCEDVASVFYISIIYSIVYTSHSDYEYFFLRLRLLLLKYTLLTWVHANIRMSVCLGRLQRFFSCSRREEHPKSISIRISAASY